MPLELILPAILDEAALESTLRQSAQTPEAQKTLILDMGPVEAIDLYAMIGLLEWGSGLRRLGRRMLLHQPLSVKTQQRLERAGFFARARMIYTVYPPYRKPLPVHQAWNEDFPLVITPIETVDDVDRAVDGLRTKLDGSGGTAAMKLSAMLARIVGPGRTGGYAAVQSDSSGITIAVSERSAARAAVSVIVLPKNP